MRTAVKIHTYT